MPNYEINMTGFRDRLALVIGEEKPFPWADRMGLSPGVFTRMWNDGIPPKAQHLVLIASKENVSIDWLLTGKGEMRPGGAVQEELPVQHCFDQEEFDYIPMVEVKLSAGGGAFVQSEGMRDFFAFRKDWLSRTVTSKRNAVLVQVIGNSMAPTILEHDVVMIDTGQCHLYDGKIYALRMDNTVMIKRIAPRPGDKVLVISDNKDEYEPYEASRQDINVLGQVVWFARSLVKND